jgi:hypothetical protein
MNKNKFILIAVSAAIILIVVLVLLLTNKSEVTAPSNKEAADKN